MNASSPAASSITTNTIVKAAQCGSQMARISATMNQKKNNENNPMAPATANRMPPVAPCLTVAVTSDLASSISERTRVDMCVEMSLTRLPSDSVRSTAGSATNGIAAPVEPGVLNRFAEAGVPELDGPVVVGPEVVGPEVVGPEVVTALS